MQVWWWWWRDMKIIQIFTDFIHDWFHTYISPPLQLHLLYLHSLVSPLLFSFQPPDDQQRRAESLRHLRLHLGHVPRLSLSQRNPQHSRIPGKRRRAERWRGGGMDGKWCGPLYSVRVYRAEEERLHIVGDLIAALKTVQGGLQLNRRGRVLPTTHKILGSGQRRGA